MPPQRFPRAYQEVVVAAVLLVVFVALRLRLDSFIAGRRGGRALVDPDFWPGWLLTLGIVLCLIYLLTAIRRALRWRLDPREDENIAAKSVLLKTEAQAEAEAKDNPSATDTDSPETTATEHPDATEQVRPSVVRLGIGFALLFGYIFLLGPIGFVPATLAFCVAFLLFIGERRWYVIGGFPILLVVLVLAAFTRLLVVPLPRGTGWWLYWSTFLY